MDPSPPTMMSASTCASFRNLACLLDYFRCHHSTISRANLGTKCPAIGGTDERSSQRHDVFGALSVEHGEITRGQQSFEAIAESEHLPTKFVCRERGTAQNGIEPGTIAAASKNTIRVFIRGKVTASFSDRPVDGSGPLIVKLPTLADEPLALTKSIVATKNYDDEVAWKNGGDVAILDTSAARFSRKNEASLTSTRSGRFWTPSMPLAPSQIVVVLRRACICLPPRLKEISALLLRNKKAESSPCHRVTGESREIDCSGIWPSVVPCNRTHWD